MANLAPLVYFLVLRRVAITLFILVWSGIGNNRILSERMRAAQIDTYLNVSVDYILLYTIPWRGTSCSGTLLPRTA